MAINRSFPIGTLFVALLAGVGVGSLIGRLLEEQPIVATSAVAGGLGVLAAAGVLELYDLYRRSRLRGYGPRIIVQFDAGKTLRYSVWGALGAFVLLSLFHAVVVGSLGSGFRMTTEDIRLLATCPTHFRTHSEFLTRDELEEIGLRVAQFVEGQSVYEQVCAQGWDAQFR